MLQQMTKHEILERYKKGERIFHKIRCIGNDFVNINLSDVDFSGSDLSFCSFKSSTLKHTNFSNCNLIWCDFSRTILSETIFEKANLSWSVFNDAFFEKTNFKKANLSCTMILNVNVLSSDMTGANKYKMVKNAKDLEGSTLAQEELERIKDKIPYDLWLLLKFAVERNQNSEDVSKIGSRVVSYFEKRSSISDDERHVLEELGLSSYISKPSAYEKKSGAYEKLGNYKR